MKAGFSIKRFGEHLRDILIVVVIGNGISFLFSPDFTNFWERLWINSLYSALIGGTLWKGNEAIAYFVGRNIDYNRYPFKALRWNLSLMFVFSLIDIVVINYLWFVVIFDWTAERMFTRIYPTMIIELVVTIVITSVFFAIEFFQSWRESAVREERLQKESIKLQYNALKNQVNPHFLFNSLNTLTSLVYKDADQSARFIKQLSEVYRYVLEHRDTELVDLATEIGFCRKYIYFQKIRHGENLHVDFEIDPTANIKVVPMSLQLLIENAIKHNEISEEKPLIIKVGIVEGFIVVTNTLQQRKTIPESGGIGLETLKRRYAFLSDKAFDAKRENGRFVVQIPVIES